MLCHRSLGCISIIAVLISITVLRGQSQDDLHAVRFQQFQQEGLRLLKTRNFSGALQHFEAALKEHSESWQTLQNIATCHNQLGNFDKAISALQKSIELGGLHASQCIAMAGALEGQGEPKKALAWLELACSVEPTQAADPVMQNRLRMLRSPMHSPTGSPNTPDYLTVLAKIHKWHNKDFPLKVFVRKNMQIPEFYDEFLAIAKDSFDQWCAATSNTITYKFVNDRESSNLICDYTDRREFVSSDHEPGIDGNTDNRFRADDGSTDWANITILVKDVPGRGHFRSREVLTKCFLHEAGHALGISGHSSNKHDVMFYCWTPEPNGKLSERDINTIRMVYQCHGPALTPPAPDLQLAGFNYIKANDFINALDCFNTALKERPKSWMIMQSIGNCEGQLGHHDKAIESYLKSMEVGGLHSTQCYNIAAAYNSIGRKDKALYWLKQGCSIDATMAANRDVITAMKILYAQVNK